MMPVTHGCTSERTVDYVRFVRRLIQAEIDEEKPQKVLQKPDGLQAVTIDELARAPDSHSPVSASHALFAVRTSERACLRMVEATSHAPASSSATGIFQVLKTAHLPPAMISLATE